MPPKKVVIDHLPPSPSSDAAELETRASPDPARGEQEQQALEQQQAVMQGLGELDLPKTVVTKLAKGELTDTTVKMQQDVVLGLIKSATVFINYFTAAAQDATSLTSRKTIMPQDVLAAVKACGFEGMIGKGTNGDGGLSGVLERELEAFRALQSSKRAANSTSHNDDPTHSASEEAGPSTTTIKETTKSIGKGKKGSTGVGRGNGRKILGAGGAGGGAVGKGRGGGRVASGTTGRKKAAAGTATTALGGKGAKRTADADLDTEGDGRQDREEVERDGEREDEEDEETERARIALAGGGGGEEMDVDVEEDLRVRRGAGQLEAGENMDGEEGEEGDGEELMDRGLEEGEGKGGGEESD